MKHLIEEPPILVYPTLAKLMGINKAIMLQQLHFLLGITEKSKNSYNFVNDRWWVYNTYPKWREDYFPWLSEITIRTLFKELEDDGIVNFIQSVKTPGDRTKWYSINYEKWDEFIETMCGKSSHDTSDENHHMIISGKSSHDLSESTSESTSENLPPSAVSASPPTGMKTFASAEPSPAEEKPAKLKAQPELARKIAFVFGIPKIAKAKLVLIQEQCVRYVNDPVYTSWVDDVFLPSKTRKNETGQQKPTTDMDGLLAMLIDEQGYSEYQRTQSVNLSGSVDESFLEDPMEALLR